MPWLGDRDETARRDHVIRRRRGSVAARGTVSAIEAKKAAKSIPLVFVIGSDPVRVDLVTSLNRPGGNATGVTLITTGLEAKRLELLRQLVPSAS